MGFWICRSSTNHMPRSVRPIEVITPKIIENKILLEDRRLQYSEIVQNVKIHAPILFARLSTYWVTLCSLTSKIGVVDKDLIATKKPLVLWLDILRGSTFRSFVTPRYEVSQKISLIFYIFDQKQRNFVKCVILVLLLRIN